MSAGTAQSVHGIGNVVCLGRPQAEPAAFTTLRAKGAYLVSAAWDPKSRAAHSVSITATVDSPHVSLASPFGPAVRKVALRCGEGKGQTVGVDAQGKLGWAMGAGETCAVDPSSSS